MAPWRALEPESEMIAEVECAGIVSVQKSDEFSWRAWSWGRVRRDRRCKSSLEDASEH